MAQSSNLSKAEIEELSEAFNSVGSENPRRENVRAYDFEHPDKLSRQNIRALQLLFSGITRPWTAKLSSALRTEAVVRVGSLEQTTFSTHAEAIPTACVIASVGMPPLHGAALIDMPSAMAMRLVHCLAGGKSEDLGEPRQLTLIELNILKRVLNRLCADLSEAWRVIAPIEFGVSDFCQNAQHVEVLPDERMISVGVTLSIASEEHRLGIGIPIRTLDPVLESLEPQKWMQSQTGMDASSADIVADLLDPVCLPLAVDLGRARVSMQGLMNMEVGDVICLDREVDDPLEVKIGGRVKFRGKAGLVGKRVSVEIQ